MQIKIKTILQEKNIGLLILFFFIFGSFFPTIRALTIGSQTSTNFGEYIYSLLPEIFSILVLLFSGIIFYKNKIEIKLKFFDWIIICYAFSNVIFGTFLAKDLLLSMYGVRMSYFPILFYFIFRYGNLEIMKKTIQKIFIWFFIIGIIGIILYFGFYDLMIIMIKKTNTIIAEYFIVRMTSIFWTPVVFSTFMVVTFAYYYHQFLISPKWYHYCFLGLIWCCVLLSVSRGALGVLLIGFIILSLIHKKKKLSLQMFLVFISIYIILGFYISSPLIFSSWLAKSASDTIELEGGISRVELWIKSFENFKTHPFGYGLGKAGHIAARFFKDNGQAAAIYSTDGWYLKLANETGIWGLFSYLFLTIYLFVMLLKNKIFDNKDNVLILFFVIFLLINIQNIVSNVLDFYLFSFFYWGIVGLASNIIYSKINITKNGHINYNS